MTARRPPNPKPIQRNNTMNDQNDPLLLEHEVDGIRELDNKLPRWWVWLFYLSMTFAAVYLSIYHVFAKGDIAAYGQMAAEYRAEMKIGAALKVAAMTRFEATMASLQPSADPEAIARGKKT